MHRCSPAGSSGASSLQSSFLTGPPLPSAASGTCSLCIWSQQQQQHPPPPPPRCSSGSFGGPFHLLLCLFRRDSGTRLSPVAMETASSLRLVSAHPPLGAAASSAGLVCGWTLLLLLLFVRCGCHSPAGSFSPTLGPLIAPQASSSSQQPPPHLLVHVDGAWWCTVSGAGMFPPRSVCRHHLEVQQRPPSSGDACPS